MKLTLTLLSALLLAPLGALLAAEAPATIPNILLILCDDLGYGDLACFGDKALRTPNLDKLAAEGVRLTSCYAAHPNCSSSRTALMTGRTPTRTGVRDWIPRGSPVHMRRSEITIATLLKQAGYETCAVGKWHMNGTFNDPAQPQPGDQGFDHWFATQNVALPNHHNPTNFVRNGKPVGKIEGYSAHIVADEAISWLTEKRDTAKPFFLYVAFHEPHEPIASDPRYVSLYPSTDPSYSDFNGNISQMDDAVGRLMRTLDERGLTQDTFVFFTSDNGPAITAMHPHGSAGPLRDKKGSIHEGGIRVPGIVRWSGVATPGGSSDEPVSGMDFLPTACALAGIDVPRDRVIDGENILPVLKGGAVVRHSPLYWHFNRADSKAKVAIRVGDWKIVATLDKAPKGVQATPNASITAQDEREFKQAEPATFQLYNLRSDIAEKTDLAPKEPAKFAELKALLLAKYHEVRDEAPTWPDWSFNKDDQDGADAEWPDYVKNRRHAAPKPSTASPSIKP